MPEPRFNEPKAVRHNQFGKHDAIGVPLQTDQCSYKRYQPHCKKPGVVMGNAKALHRTILVLKERHFLGAFPKVKYFAEVYIHSKVPGAGIT